MGRPPGAHLSGAPPARLSAPDAGRTGVRGAAVGAARSRGGQGPDNEPLVEVCEPIAWVSADVLAEVDAALAEQHPDWGTLDRGT